MSAENNNDLSLAGDMVDGLLDPELTRELEIRRAEDVDFDELVRWQLALRQEVVNKEENRLKTILQNELRYQKRIQRTRIAVFAVAVLVLFLLLCYVFRPSPPTDESVYAAYYDQYPWTLKSPVRSLGEETNLISAANGAYLSPGEDASVTAFERLVVAFPDSAEYRFLFANLLLERREYERAVSILESLEDGKDDRRHYYLGLAYLASGKRDEALKSFKAVGTGERYFYGRATEIIAKLE